MIFPFSKKVFLLLVLVLYVPKSFSIALPLLNIDVKTYTEKRNIFKNKNEKQGYVLGISLGKYINESFEKQKKIGIDLDKMSLLEGIKDEIFNNSKLSKQEIISVLQELEENIKNATKMKFEKNAKENLLQGKIYMQTFSEKKGVKRTSSGLLYLIEKNGDGEEVTNNTKITVHYKGKLINGLEFDSSYKRGKPISLKIKDVILGWQEGLKYIRKGGKIKLVIPPHLGYGEHQINDIPGNSTLIFEIELLDVVNTE